MDYELLAHSVRGSSVCNCDMFSTCASMSDVYTSVRSWEELIQLMKDTPHMVTVVSKIRELRKSNLPPTSLDSPP